MDPLSIVMAVTALVGICVKVRDGLEELHNGVKIIDAKVQALRDEVTSFVTVLELMKTTLEDKKVQASFPHTGHIGNHWKNISACINDGEVALGRLAAAIERVDKPVVVLESTRKYARMHSAADEITVYQQQIRTYRDTMHLSIQTVILWNQVFHQESTDKILPKLDDLTKSVQKLARDVNRQTSALRGPVESEASQERLQSLGCIESCIITSKDILSSASTALGLNDKTSTTTASDLDDIFPFQPGETMIRWISNNVVAESEADGANQPAAAVSSAISSSTLEQTVSALGLDDSDSDGGIEVDIVEAQLQQAKRELMSDNRAEAERHLRAGLERLRRNQHRFRNSTTKLDILNLLLDIYHEGERWSEVRDIMVERLHILSRAASSADDGAIHANHPHLQDILQLGRVLLRLQDTAQARVFAKKCLKAYKKMGHIGREGQEDALRLLVEICRADGDEDGEAFGLLLSSMAAENVPSGAVMAKGEKETLSKDTVSEADVPEEVNDEGRSGSPSNRSREDLDYAEDQSRRDDSIAAAEDAVVATVACAPDRGAIADAEIAAEQPRSLELEGSDNMTFEHQPPATADRRHTIPASPMPNPPPTMGDMPNRASSTFADGLRSRIDVLVAGPDEASRTKIIRELKTKYQHTSMWENPTDSSLFTDVEQFESLDVKLGPKGSRALKVQLRLWNVGFVLQPGAENPHPKSLVDHLQDFVKRTGLETIGCSQLCILLCFRPNSRKHARWLDSVGSQPLGIFSNVPKLLVRIEETIPTNPDKLGDSPQVDAWAGQMLSKLKELNARACFTLFINDRGAIREFLKLIAKQDWKTAETLMLGTYRSGKALLYVYRTDGTNYVIEGVPAIQRTDSLNSYGSTLVGSEEVRAAPTNNSKKEGSLRKFFRRKSQYATGGASWKQSTLLPEEKSSVRVSTHIATQFPNQ